MGSHFLDVYEENSGELIDEYFDYFKNKQFTNNQLLDMCTHYQIKALACWLRKCDINKTTDTLRKCSATYLWGLTRISDEVRLSMIDPFYVSLASNDKENTEKILNILLTIDWRNRVEYREDYLEQKALLLCYKNDPDLLKSILDEYDIVSECKTSALIEIVKALSTGNQDTFDVSIERYLLEYHNYMNMMYDKGHISDEIHYTLGKICIKGAALLKLAKRYGLMVETEYHMIPSQLSLM